MMRRRPLRAAPSAAALLAAAVVLAGCSSQGTPAATKTPAGKATQSASSPSTSTSPSASDSTSPTSAPAKLRLRASAASWHLPSPLAREAAVVLAPATALVAGGLIAGDGSTANAYRIDLSTGKVTTAASLPVPVHDTAGGVASDGSVLVVAGGNASEQSVVQRLDPASGAWSVVGHLPQARSDLGVVTYHGRLFAVGGYDGSTPALPQILSSRNGKRWSVSATLPDPVRYAATTVLDGVLWVFGGERSGLQRDSVQRVNLSTGQSSIVTHLPHPLGHASAVAVGTKVLLVGGRLASGGISNQCWWFDPSTDRFTKAGRLPWPLADSAPVTVGPDTYLLGGETPSLTDKVVLLHVTGLTP